MKILAIDTSTEACSVAVYIDGDSRERFEIARQRHTELILPMIESLLAESGLNSVKDFDALAFGRGPGSFTGIRIGTGVVQGIALGSGLPVAPVSTLAAMAQGVYRLHQESNVLAAIDARMHEVYWGCYQLDDNGYMQAVQDEVVGKPGSLSLPEQHELNWFGAGSAWSAYTEDLRSIAGARLSAYDGSCLPHAIDVAHLAGDVINTGGLVTADNIEPVYLRNEVAWKKPG